MTPKDWLLKLSGAEADPQWLERHAPWDPDEVLFDAWAAAHADAELALLDWQARGGAEAYCVYRAAADREDAAHDALRAREREVRRPAPRQPATKRA